MRLKITYLKAQLLLILFSLSLFAFAQAENNEIKQLQGKWVLEDVSFVEVTGTTRTKVSSVGVDIYNEIEIRQDTVFLLYNDNIEEGKFVVDDTYLSFDFTSAPYSAEWAIVDDKLYLERKIKDIYDELKTTIVTSAYKRK